MVQYRLNILAILNIDNPLLKSIYNEDIMEKFTKKIKQCYYNDLLFI